ncbi:hypothetical protein TNCV_3339091 [Trichonephila clavipes]|nr:hypothetical protein TNCV_3339091 [Trichonephila clavipes]
MGQVAAGRHPEHGTPPLLVTTTPRQRGGDVSALDRFNVHRCPTRRESLVVLGSELQRRDSKPSRSPLPLGYRGPSMYCVALASNDEAAHFWLNDYVNKQNCRAFGVEELIHKKLYVEATRYIQKKLTVWCALWAGGILLQKR